MTAIHELLLPRSGLRLQWRADTGYLRVEVPAGTRPITGEGARWQPCVEPDTIFAVAGTSADTAERWWVVWGMCSDSDVDVVLPDGSRPRVVHLGRVWAAEWTGPPRSARVRIGGHEAGVPFEMPSFMTPSGPEPRTGRISEGWARFAR
ncbi:hypothetical protein [Nocardia spumae]|uniref:hypothetical protein n=1 Tax=Nocardia spumae TaxID=2887190 RepID=UPI001D132D50|nr:hypothetical protein [Nocardia spumae]